MFKKLSLNKFLQIGILIMFSFGNLQADDGTASNTYEGINDKIVINDIPLSYNIEIVGSNSRFIYNLLDARVTIKNKDTNRHSLEYKFIWFDENGFEIAKNRQRWKEIYLDAKDSKVIRDLAVTSKIDTFKLYIRAKK